ncbi:hypothetical protein BEP19_15715 [Ammoniphilus oxalaticus]|uniref:Virulence-associated protein E-like domain-containing protein n=2 Tax=Ammoniphilus oxalaticus TaxID=66863 RepID=A0A419SDQ3_9BACL|nr:hypothetical protein BEP19_15715 [Ammoniphilus oxalaticus]
MEGIPSNVIELAKKQSELKGDDWRSKLEYGETRNKGQYLLKNGRNVELILSNIFTDSLAFDSFTKTEVIKTDLPWRKRMYPHKKYEPWLGSDDNRLQHWFETTWNINTTGIIQNAFIETTRRNSFHPIKDYLESQQWDGIHRIDRLFIDYLGAEDSPYMRSVTRKWLTAAVTRVYKPGCKFDYMPVIVGPQGAGKSTIIAKIAGEWFSDSLRNFDSKEAGEHLQSAWIFEIGELAAMKRNEVEEIKAFISKTDDAYRMAYERTVSTFPRQCVFIGTTNTKDFLRDQTGNRRFWPIEVDPSKRKFTPFVDLTTEIIGQIWAEAMRYYKQGETLHLDPDLEEVARQSQQDHMVQDPRIGMIQQYLETPLPSNWDDMQIWERKRYLQNPTGDLQRERVCAAEIWAECLDRNYKDMGVWDSREIYDIVRNIGGWKERKPNRTTFKHYGKQTTFVRTV